MPDPRPLRALLCERDPVLRIVTEQELVDGGFEISGFAETAVEAIRLNDLLRPSLVVISNDQLGMSGIDAVPELRAQGDEPEIVLVASDDSIRETAVAAGAFDVVVQGDGPMLARMLTEVRSLLETGERRKSNDRRVGNERREQQDWSKVTAERRAEENRRSDLRREKDVTSKAREVLTNPPRDDSD